MTTNFSVRPIILAACCFALAPCLRGAAAEAVAQTEPEKLHASLVELDDPANKLLVASWKDLVRQRQWVDISGKYRVYAKYVKHDAGLQSVTLLVLSKQGDKQTYAEKTIPVAKLGKAEQALVKRIDAVRKRVEAAVAKGPAEGALPTGEGGEEVVYRGETRVGRPGEEAPPAEETPAAELPPQVGEAPPAVDPVTALMAMGQPWRVDFNEFARQLTPAPTEVELTGDVAPPSEVRRPGEVRPAAEVPQPAANVPSTATWGELKELEAVYRTEQTLAQIKKLPAAQRPPMFQLGFMYGLSKSQLGEVSWETTLESPVEGSAELKHDLKLPEPFTLVLVPDAVNPGALKQARAGDRIRFIGQFLELGGFTEKPQIKLSVRVPDAGATAPGVVGRPTGYGQR